MLHNNIIPLVPFEVKNPKNAFIDFEIVSQFNSVFYRYSFYDLLKINHLSSRYRNNFW